MHLSTMTATSLLSRVLIVWPIFEHVYFRVCQFTFNDVNPHWGVDVVRYGAGVVTLVHGARLPHNLNLHIQQTQKIDQEILFVDLKDALHSALCLIGAFMYMEIFIQNYDMHCCIYVSKNV